MQTPTSLQQAIVFFSVEENCAAYLKAVRWPDGTVKCPHCGSANVKWLENARIYKCFEKHARQKFSLKVGTIFEDSPIPLSKWLPAVWMVMSCRNGVSSWEIHRALDVTQKTAWFMLHRIRLAMQDEDYGGKLDGTVEIDETWIGGKARNMHKDRKARMFQGLNGGGSSGKTPVQGMMERGGKVRAKVVESARYGELIPNVYQHVEEGANVMTDEASVYECLRGKYNHEVINHTQAYVNGNIHTNTLENFWSLLKRTLGGTYVSVEPFHLFRYVDEQAFRFNNRLPMKDGDRFKYLIRKIVGKRLTYAELTGKVGETCPA